MGKGRCEKSAWREKEPGGERRKKAGPESEAKGHDMW